MASTTASPQLEDEAGGLRVHCFTNVVDELALHLQIIRLPKQIYAWIGCNSSKMGRLYAAAHTRPGDGVSVSCVLGGSSDNPGAGIARRIVLKSGLNVILASNIPKNSPMIEANAERNVMEREACSVGIYSAKIRTILVINASHWFSRGIHRHSFHQAIDKVNFGVCFGHAGLPLWLHDQWVEGMRTM